MLSGAKPSPYSMTFRLPAWWFAVVLLFVAVLTGQSGVRVSSPAKYIPNTPYVVRVEALDNAGNIDRELWNAEAQLESLDPQVTLSTNRVQLKNGLGTALLGISGTRDFTLQVTLGTNRAQRSVIYASTSGAVAVSGVLPGANTTWNGVVRVTGTVTVPVGHVLTIQPGTVVLLDGRASGTAAPGLIVNGSVQCLGTWTNPVSITCADMNLNWGQIRHDNAGPSVYQHTFISKAGRAPGEGHTGTAPLLRPSNSQVTLDHCVLSDLTAGGVAIGKSMMANNSTLVISGTVMTRSRMGPEIAGTQLLCTNTWFTEMRGPDDSDGVYVHDANGRSMVLSSCVMAGGDDDAIDTLAANLLVEGCILRDFPNPNEDAKGVSAFHGDVFLNRCLIVNCFVGASAKSSGPLSNLRLDHCTIEGNTRGISATLKDNASAGNITIYATNCIVQSPDPLHTDFGPDKFVSVTYSDINTNWPGAGNINLNPLFANTSAGDYRLLRTSPCIDAGDPAFALDSNASRTDMGYYTGLAGATGLAVSITNPVELARLYAPTNVLIQAAVRNGESVVKQVDFYVGTSLVGVSTSAPFASPWEIRKVGAYILTAVVRDWSGLNATSAPVRIEATIDTRPVTNVLVSAGSTWRYLDDGSNQGTNWTHVNFSDAQWRDGPAKLGYGDGDEATTLNYGPSSTTKYVTYYFRQLFNLSDTQNISAVILRLLRDDGAIVYLNGREAFRVSMPAGAVDYRTFATSSSDYTWRTAELDPALLVRGENLIAVEVHQGGTSSSDMGMDLELASVLTRPPQAAPYVQIVAPGTNASIIPGAVVLLRADAFDVDGAVTNVTFFADGVPVGQDVSEPYAWSWTWPQSGVHEITASAADDSGLITVSAPISIIVSTNIARPVVASVLPPPGPVTNLHSITVVFNKPVHGVDRGDLLVDGAPAVSVYGTNTEYTFNFANVSAGTRNVTWAQNHGITDTFQPPQPFDSGGPGSTWTYQSLDTIRPRLRHLTPIPGTVVAALTNISVVFDEPVSGVRVGSLTLNGVAATRVEGANAGPYVFSFPVLKDGRVVAQWTSPNTITDLGGNGVVPAARWYYTLDSERPRVMINEIMYHPSSENSLEEFVELYNEEPWAVDLAGWQLTRAIDYTFGDVTLPANGYLVVAADVATFRTVYPGVTNVVGGWTGFLGNTTEQVVLRNARSNVVSAVRYADEGDWAVRQKSMPLVGARGWEWLAEHDGMGASVEMANHALPAEEGQNWRSSRVAGGTPGATNSVFTNQSAPLILQTAHSPVIPRSTQAVVVQSRVEDDTLLPVTAILHYRSDSAAPGAFAGVPMNDDGLGGDAAAGDGIYAASLPPHSNNTIVEFYVTAEDSDGLSSSWPSLALPAPDSLGSPVQVVNALYQVDDSSYAGGQPLYHVIMREAERAQLQSIMDNVNQTANSDAQMNGTFISSHGDSIELRYLVGVRNRGHGTRIAKPNNFRVNFRSDERWNGVQAINLNAQFSWLQVLGAALETKSLGLGAYSQPVQLRVNNANLTLNSSIDRTYGSYAANEVVNADWADRRFPSDGEGNIYRALRDLNPSDFDYRTVQQYPTLYGPDNKNSYTNTWFKQNNQSEDDWRDLISMLRVLGMNGTEGFNPENVKRVINPEQWMRYFAIMSLLGSSETSIASGYNDDYILYSGIEDTRFLLLYYDLDQILGFNRSSDPTAGLFQAAQVGSGKNAAAAMNRLMHHPEFEPLYYAALQELLATSFSPEAFNTTVDETLAGFVPETVRSQIKDWMSRRRATVLPLIPQSATLPRAMVSGFPRSPSPAAGATLNVYGAGVAAYSYSLNGGVFSAFTSPSQPIIATPLQEGTNVLLVIGRNSSGFTQSLPTEFTWVFHSAMPPVRINEVSVNTGSSPDLVELYNESTNTVELRGMSLTDDANNPRKYVFAARALPPMSYVVISSTELGFGLNGTGESLSLYDVPERGGLLLDSVTFGQQLAGYSIGRIGLAGAWRLNTPSLGSANVSVGTAVPQDIFINEWMAPGAAPLTDGFIELFNGASLPADVGGHFLTDQPATVPRMFALPAAIFIAPRGYLVIRPSNSAVQPTLGFAPNAEGGELALFNAEGDLMQSVWYPRIGQGQSRGSFPDGASSRYDLAMPTPGSANLRTTNPDGTGGGVVLNEVLAANRTFLEADGSNPDWIELYNSSNAPVDLSGMSLTDDPSVPQRWVIPTNTVLGAGNYLKLLCDENFPAFATNTGFSLSSHGGAVYLHQPATKGGAVIDFINYGPQAMDWSIGRVPDGGTNWTLTLPTPRAANIMSALASAQGNLKVNEWMADPASGPDWFEIWNGASAPVALGGYSFSDALTGSVYHKLPALTFIGSGPGAFQVYFADEDLQADADHVGFRLSGAGEAVALFDSSGQIVHAVSFGTQQKGISEGLFPDGQGTRKFFTQTQSPAAPNYLPTTVVANEILAHTNAAFENAIELYNSSSSPVDISGWYLSDSALQPAKYQIPQATLLPPYGYKMIYEYEFNHPDSPEAFHLDGLRNGQVALSEAVESALTGYRSQVEFEPSAPGTSFGRFTTSVATHFVPLLDMSFASYPANSLEQFRRGSGQQNGYAKVGPLVITEFMYHPPVTNDALEFVEIYNPTTSPVPMRAAPGTTNGWRLRGAVEFLFPTNLILQPQSVAVIVSFDPAVNSAEAQAFSAAYGTGQTKLGPWQGKLNNASETVALMMPVAATNGASELQVFYVTVDRVRYSDSAPWPRSADGAGASLQRVYPHIYGDDPANWLAIPPTPGRVDSDGDALPDAWETLHGLSSSNAVDAAEDMDHDSASNLAEYVAGTGPASAQSVLECAIRSSAGEIELIFNGHAGRSYFLERWNGASAPGTWITVRALPVLGADQTVVIPLTVDSASALYRVRVAW